MRRRAPRPEFASPTLPVYVPDVTPLGAHPGTRHPTRTLPVYVHHVTRLRVHPPTHPRAHTPPNPRRVPKRARRVTVLATRQPLGGDRRPATGVGNNPASPWVNLCMHTQGSLDGTCGLYSIANAVSELYGGDAWTFDVHAAVARAIYTDRDYPHGVTSGNMAGGLRCLRRLSGFKDLRVRRLGWRGTHNWGLTRLWKELGDALAEGGVVVTLVFRPAQPEVYRCHYVTAYNQEPAGLLVRDSAASATNWMRRSDLRVYKAPGTPRGRPETYLDPRCSFVLRRAVSQR